MQTCHILLCGDFNSHFGDIVQPPLLGPILHSSPLNSNGQDMLYMMEELELEALTTKYDYSTRITWRVGTKTSQIDHLIIPQTSTVIATQVRGQWTKFPTDHKLISCRLTFPPMPPTIPALPPPFRPTTDRRPWNLPLLSIERIQAQYENYVVQHLNPHAQSQLTLSQRWDFLCQLAGDAATQFIQHRSQTSDPLIAAAFGELRRQLNIVNKLRMIDTTSNYNAANDSPPSLLPGELTNLKEARKNYDKVRQELRIRKLNKFLDDIERETSCIGEKVQSAFKFIKTSRQTSLQNTSPVTLNDWQKDLDAIAGQSPALIPETDGIAPNSAPTMNEVCEVLMTMKNSRSPGQDALYVEMLKASPTLTAELKRIIRQAYMTNEVPLSWKVTTSVPIPKKKKPQTVDDYRKITLCSTGYKVYVKLLMKRLQTFISPMHDYQAGFVPNKSCDDHLFTVKRVLEERWTKGLATYVLSLDLRKAFDRVNIHLLPQILADNNVPHFLINRIIASCFTESNCIKWYGQQTEGVTKALGVKQGCPGSPQLFNLILNRAILDLQSQVKQQHNITLYLGETPGLLTLPLVLAFADDILIISRNFIQLKYIIAEFVPILSTYGLEINGEKSGVMIKDVTPVSPGQQITINSQLKLPVVSSIKYLGITIPSDMSRRNSIRSRCASSVALSRALVPYLKKLKAPIEVIMKLYHAIIVPSLIYGLKSCSITQANKKTLMRREISIIKELSSFAHPRPKQNSIYQLLDGKTINRKVTVQRVRYYGHIKRREPASLLRKALSYHEPHRRKIGRPLYTYNVSLTNDMRQFESIDHPAWEDLYPDRELLKRVTSLLYQTSADQDIMDPELMLYGEDED